MVKRADLPPTLGQGQVLDLPAGPAEPWERQPRESDQAWALFKVWRDMAYPNGLGEGYVVRTLPDMARLGGWDLAQLRRIAQSFDWANRAAQYDRTIDTHKTEANLDALPKVLEDHRKILQDMRNLVADQLGKWLTVCVASDAPQVKIRDLKSIIDSVVKLDRLTLGESTEIVKLDGAWDLSGLTLDQLRALKEVAQKAGGEIKPVE